MKKKILATLLALVLVIGSFSGIDISAASSLNEENMERVLLIVKEKLDVDDYEKFDYSFYDYSGKTQWNFIWRNEDYSEYVSVTADDEGHIRYYSNSSNDYKRGIPSVTADEMKDTAFSWIEKIEPSIAGSVELTDTRYVYYNNSYAYTFTRVKSGIQMPENLVDISLSANDGKLLSYRENWNYDVKLPAAKDLITKQEAAAKIGTQVDMELKYFRSWGNDGKEKVFLAYVPSRSYVAVNAKTGKIYTKKYYLDGEWDGADEEAAMGDYAAFDNGTGVAAKNASISQAERLKIDEIKDIISADDAKKLILENPYLYREEADYTVSSDLTAEDNDYFWNIYLEDSRPYDYDDPDADWYRSSIYATVNAKTGEIISYNASVRSMYDIPEDQLAQITINYTKKQCRDNFESFVKQYNPDRFKDTKLGNTSRSIAYNYDYATGKFDYAGFNFSYIRTHEGVPFEANGINGEVEAITGKVVSYYSNWDEDIEFPSSKDVIGAQKAFECYMGYEGYDLVYELVTVYGKKTSEAVTKSRLVYRTDIPYSYVDAKTGEQLNYWGEKYDRKAEKYEYTDIAGSKYERAIRLLADMGIGLAKTEFKPDEKMTAEDFDALLEQSSNFTYYYIYDVAEKEETKTDNNAAATREYIAEKIIDSMGYGKLAKLDIYKTGFDDEADIKNVGAVALAKGFGLMGAKSGNSFKPATVVTNGEAAELILKLMAWSATSDIQ